MKLKSVFSSVKFIRFFRRRVRVHVLLIQCRVPRLSAWTISDKWAKGKWFEDHNDDHAWIRAFLLLDEHMAWVPRLQWLGKKLGCLGKNFVCIPVRLQMVSSNYSFASQTANSLRRLPWMFPPLRWAHTEEVNKKQLLSRVSESNWKCTFPQRHTRKPSHSALLLFWPGTQSDPSGALSDVSVFSGGNESLIRETREDFSS